VSKKPLTPYEYILFHQAFRKVFKNNMTLEQAKKVMPAAVNQSVEEEKKEGEQNV
jgi:20S proteasome alpha/beta subunit